MTGLPSTWLLTGTTAGVVALIALNLARAARGASLPRSLAPSVAVGMVAWLGITAVLAWSGIIGVWTAFPPRWPLLPLTALVTSILLGLTPTAGRLLAEIPPWQPVALETFRVAVELAFWSLHARGMAPVQVTFEGRNLDALVGLTAPLIAAGIATRRIGPRPTIAWNIFGLAMLINAIATVATSTPGPLHLDWEGEPFRAIVSWPVVWIPAFLAPIGISMHVVSIRQALRNPGSPAGTWASWPSAR